MASAIGQRIPMVDSSARVTGQMGFVLDLELPGMLHTRILRSPHAHANVLRVDASRAAALPGVKAVLTRDDLVDRPDVFPTYGLFIRDQPVVAIDRVRHVGDPVAAVAAIDERTADEALSLIDVDYEPLPAVFDVEEALAEGAPILHPGARSLASRRPDILARQPGFEGSNVIHEFIQKRGDVKAGFADADVIIENVFDCPPVQHVSMEPHVCVAEWRDGRLTLWDSTQAPNWVQTEVANTCRVSASDVRVIVPTLGGGYGGKIDPSIEPIAALLSRKARRPVRVALHRDEEFFTHTKHGARVRIRTGAKRDGTLVAHEATCWYNGGAYSKETPEKITRGYASMGPYRVPNVHVESFGVYTNVTPSAAFRGFGIPQVSWAHESQMDELADALGMDPLELRLRNVLREGDTFSTGESIRENMHYEELLQLCAEKVGWSDSGPGPERVSGEPGHGIVRARGVSVIIKGMSAFPSSSVAKLNTDGSMNVLTGSVEMGQGALTALAQIVSDESTIPVSRVRISTPDTAVTPWDQMSAASRTTNNMGKAMRAAVVDVKQQLLELASKQMEIAPTDLEVAAGTVRPKDAPEKALPFPAILGPARVGNIIGRGTYQAVAHLDLDGQGIGSPQWHPAACGVEVEVDEETGRVRITKMHVGLYVGRMINPLQCELQVEGAALFGVGQALFEEILWDDSGQLTNPNLSDYMIPSFLDVPTIAETILESDTTEVHGLGETGLPTVSPAVGNAVSRAIGVRLHQIPLTPERVLRAIQSSSETAEAAEAAKP
jgi:CO/xanthine dehydrogenase Mo-binding subunit